MWSVPKDRPLFSPSGVVSNIMRRDIMFRGIIPHRVYSTPQTQYYTPQGIFRQSDPKVRPARSHHPRKSVSCTYGNPIMPYNGTYVNYDNFVNYKCKKWISTRIHGDIWVDPKRFRHVSCPLQPQRLCRAVITYGGYTLSVHNASNPWKRHEGINPDKPTVVYPRVAYGGLRYGILRKDGDFESAT